ncbi:triadin-like isoform X2 [Cimex lectularius]|uniref:Uncharacterized protein n=1 Tax=Cimex lectularius TaxID=79782 RepID=A0A8I6SNS7_CIMLE|nr:triadin-like isoform X2 [Cimex lectularius]
MHLKMLSALRDDWLPQSDPFSPFGDMEAEIAELKTMTRVTKVRQQIECREEGAWMVVRDVPDANTKSGTRKVTSYGRASRSITRSCSGNVDLDSLLLRMPSRPMRPETENEVLIEYPEEENPAPPSSVEIIEVVDEEPKPEKKIEVEIPNPEKTSPIKKTSVVTLGKGNLVLIDDEDSNFRVTGISKGKVADAVSTLERISSNEKGEKKVKKVGFCKTEVHFAPDSGKINIVETDEKPPPTQILRRKKRSRNVNKKNSDLPKLYFGDEERGSEREKEDNFKVTEHVFPVIREPSPLLSTSVTNLTNEKIIVGKGHLEPKEVQINSFCPVENVSSVSPELKVFEQNEEQPHKQKNSISYLGNVSPKLNKLIQNSLQHEFQLKQRQIMSKPKPPSQQQSSFNIKLGKDTENESKSITHVNMTETLTNEKEEHTLTNERAKSVEPLYANKVVQGVEKQVVKQIEDKEKAPKPKPRTSITKISVNTKEPVRPVRTANKPLEKVPRKNTLKPKEVVKKEVVPIKPIKPYSRSVTPKQTEPVKKIKVKTEVTNGSHKLQKLIKNTTEKANELRGKKPREPLRSFEKVSNGWVGHCIVPIKNSPKLTDTVSTTNVTSNTTASSQSTGTKRSSETKTLIRSSKASLSTNRQFSLSKEHLKSAKLVKELSKDKGEVRKPDLPRSKVNIVKPHNIESNKHQRGKSIVMRRKLQYEDSYGRLRRDSDLSDDSVIRADEEEWNYKYKKRQFCLRNWIQSHCCICSII